MTILRDKNTTFETFRLAASKLSYLLIIEATKELDLKDKQINTPLVETKGKELTSNTVAISVLRAGLGLIDGPKDLIPNMTFGYIGVQRNEETAEPENYYENLPEVKDKDIFDLMGGTTKTKPSNKKPVKKKKQPKKKQSKRLGKRRFNKITL